LEQSVAAIAALEILTAVLPFAEFETILRTSTEKTQLHSEIEFMRLEAHGIAISILGSRRIWHRNGDQATQRYKISRQYPEQGKLAALQMSKVIGKRLVQIARTSF
jgi:hypothetical protein